MKYLLIVLLLACTLLSCYQEEEIIPYYRIGINSPIYGYVNVECDSLLQLGSLVKYDEHYYLVVDN